KETKKLKKDRKPIVTKTVLINLATQQKVEFEKIRRFAFSGEQAGWIALHRAGAEAAAPPSPSPAPSAGGSAPASDKASGTDLILYELATGNQLNIGNVSEFGFDKKGERLALIIDAAEKTGNGVQLRNMATGEVLPLETE